MAAATITTSPVTGWTGPGAASTPDGPSLRLVERGGDTPIADRATLLRAALVAVALAVVLGLVSHTSAQVWPAEPVPQGSTVRVVEPGDTLWGLARDVYPEGDIGPLVSELVAERRGEPLRVGEVIDLAAG